MPHLRKARPGETLYLYFSTFSSDDPAASMTITGLAVGDIKIYKDGGTTERASTNGYTLLDTDGIDFDGITGIHGVSIDLSDNSTANFYEAGSHYTVVIDSITLDAGTIRFVLAEFTIGYEGAILDTTIATLSSQTSFTLEDGSADNDAYNGCVAYVHDLASAVQVAIGVVTDYVGSTKTITLAGDPGIFTMAAGDNISLFIPANTQFVGGTSQTAGDIVSDLVVIDNAVSDVESSLVIVKSDLVVIDDAISDVESSLVIAKSDLAVIESDTTQLQSDSAVIEASVSDIESSLVIVKSDQVLAEGMLSDIESSLVIVKSDQVVAESMLSDVESSLVIVKSDLVVVESDTTIIEARNLDRMIKTTITGLSSQTVFNLSAGSADDDAYNNALALVTDSATGTQQCIGEVSDYTGATKTITLSADPGVFTMANGDTIEIFAKLAGAAGGTDWSAGERAQILSDLAAIHSDTTIITSDILVIEGAVSDIESSLVIVKSDLTVLDNAISDIESSLVIAKSDLAVIESDTTVVESAVSDVESSLVIVKSDLVKVESDTAVIEGAVSDIESSLVIVKSDQVVAESMLSDIESSLVIAKSDLVIIGSDTALIENAISDVESSIVIIKSDQVVAEAMLSDIESSLVIAKSDLAVIESDTTVIESDTTVIEAQAASGIKKNTAMNNFEFTMIDSTDDISGKTGLAITAERSLDGGAFASMTNSATEVGNGVYKINLSAADTNADFISYKFTGTGANATIVHFKTV
jgi:hypothetical protein